jgi:hypothetical protein
MPKWVLFKILLKSSLAKYFIILSILTFDNLTASLKSYLICQDEDLLLLNYCYDKTFPCKLL